MILVQPLLWEGTRQGDGVEATRLAFLVMMLTAVETE